MYAGLVSVCLARKAHNPPCWLEHLFDTGRVEGWRAEQQRQQTNAWSPGQKILNSTGDRVPEHTFGQPVPIMARIEWAKDGVEQLETEALGWTDRRVYVRMTDPRYRLTSGVAQGRGRQEHPEVVCFPCWRRCWTTRRTRTTWPSSLSGDRTTYVIRWFRGLMRCRACEEDSG
jgi:hypothetical protein